MGLVGWSLFLRFQPALLAECLLGGDGSVHNREVGCRYPKTGESMTYLSGRLFFFSPVDQEGDGRLELGLGRFDGAARECKAQ